MKGKVSPAGGLSKKDRKLVGRLSQGKATSKPKKAKKGSGRHPKTRGRPGNIQLAS